MADDPSGTTSESEQELTEIQAELAALEHEPTIERPRFEALKRRVAAFQAAFAARK